MQYSEFVWTDRALGRIALNGVSEEDGRTLVCIYEIIDELRVLPITAFFPSQSHEHNFFDDF